MAVEDGAVHLGHDASITKGVTIGDGAIVASNIVVVDDVPPETIVAGNPAKPVVEGEIDWNR